MQNTWLQTNMSCTLSGPLYKAPPRNPCLEEGYSDCISQVSSDAAISATAHRCMEQTCYTVGSCLMQPCQSLRPSPPLLQLQSLAKGCQDAQPEDTLLCAFLNIDDYKLYYDSYDASSGVRDCWAGMAKTLANKADIYNSTRVWEQIGYTRTTETKPALQAYDAAYKDLIQDSMAGAL